MRGIVTTLLFATVAACQPYRVEYHDRPDIYQAASQGDLPDQITMPDGRVIVFRPVERPVRSPDRDEDAVIFQPRTVNDDGSVVLRALQPEHVLVNTLGCLYSEEYDLLWEQMLAERTKEEYDRRGQDYSDFRAFFAQNRIELARTLNRMVRGLALHDAVVDNVEPGVLQYRFQPRIGTMFQYRRVLVARENGWYKLLTIK